MEYTINQLASMAKISTRTLRYYHEIGLLPPARVARNGYRIYGKEEVDTLQQIMFFRELGMNLKTIKELINSPNFDREKTLQSHLTALILKKEQIEALISNVRKTIKTMKGEIEMSDHEKFEGFKQRLIDENEEKYGKEVREKYGDEAVDASNAKLMGMTKEQYKKAEKLSQEINETIKKAMETGDPAGELAQKACELHKEWLTMFWKEGTYSKEAHKNLGQMYVADERFKAYYDKIQPGAAEFFCKALEVYCS